MKMPTRAPNYSWLHSLLIITSANTVLVRFSVVPSKKAKLLKSYKTAPAKPPKSTASSRIKVLAKRKLNSLSLATSSLLPVLAKPTLATLSLVATTQKPCQPSSSNRLLFLSTSAQILHRLKVKKVNLPLLARLLNASKKSSKPTSPSRLSQMALATRYLAAGNYTFQF